MRQRPVSRECHEAGSGPERLPGLHVAAWDQNQHWTLELPADQTPATDSIRRPHLATDRRRARNGFLQRAEVGGARLSGRSVGEFKGVAWLRWGLPARSPAYRRRQSAYAFATLELRWTRSGLTVLIFVSIQGE